MTKKHDEAVCELEASLRAGGFVVSSEVCSAGVALSATRHGCRAKLTVAEDGRRIFLEPPCILRNGDPTRIVDRGFQKFLKHGGMLLPLTAEALRSLHIFQNELSAVIASNALYGDALGPISETHEYPPLLRRAR